VAEVVLISGLSGAGRSGAAGVFEDLGWYVVDNLPTSLVPTIVELAAKPGSDIARLALVSGRQHGDLLPFVGEMRADGHQVTLLFLDAATSELVRRYDATRRRHPLVDEADGLLESIELERRLLDPVREAADLVIDTTGLNIHQLKDRLLSAFSHSGEARLQVSIESFGFKHGLPMDADIVMDVRFLPNPHWNEDLRPLTGHDPVIRDFALENAAAEQFMEQFDGLLSTLLPLYQAEGRSYLTVAVGCTGGRHRSVAVVEEITRRFRERGLAVRSSHRDLSRSH
jgi:UPF0042 nucleotide-binding protein